MKNKIGINFAYILKILGEKLYSDPRVFLRENVQNAVDALRLLPLEKHRSESHTKVEVRTQQRKVEVEDWGIGMSSHDLETFFWSLGESSKRTQEAMELNVVGHFGVGAFANFGICTSVEVHTWRIGNDAIVSKIHKSDLERGNIEYQVSGSQRLKHFGTIIIGEMRDPPRVEELRAYLKNHIRFLPELIYFDGELLSGETMPLSPAKSSREVARSQISFGKADAIEVDLRFFSNGRGPIEVSLQAIARGAILRGHLKTATGPMQILLNGFLIASDFQMMWWSRLPMTGLIDTNLATPNIAREGLDSETYELFSDFLERLSSDIIEVLGRNDLLFSQAEILGFLARGPIEKSKPLMQSFPVRVFGSAKRLSLAELTALHNEKQVAILIAESEDLPSHISSLKDQGVVSVLLGDLDPNVRKLVTEILRRQAGAEMISDFELKAVPISEENLTVQLRGMRSAITESLRRDWFLAEPRVTLCKSENPHHVVSLRDSGGSVEIFVNVESGIFKKLSEYLGSPSVGMLIRSLMLHPHLGQVLVRFLPQDFQAAIAHYLPRPHLQRIEKVDPVCLVSGPSRWNGPSGTCIQITSDDFKELEGYYIRLPERLGVSLEPLLRISSTPQFVWWVDNLVIISEVEKDSFVTIDLRVDCMLSTGTTLQGTANDKRRALIYQTGVFIPIPVPPFRRLLPFDEPREVTFGFRLIGVGAEYGNLLEDDVDR